jgi:hypothetical protein
VPDCDVRMIVEETLAFHDRFWAAGRGDTAGTLHSVHTKLGQVLPSLLQAVYTRTSLRQSQQLHLHGISDVHIVGEYVVFSYEQQACWSYAVSLADSAQDPPVYSNKSRQDLFSPTGCRLAEFLRHYWIVNRPFEPPCADVALDTSQLLSWQPLVFSSPETVLDGYLVKDCYVYFDGMDRLGAPTNTALRILLEELDELDCADLYLLENDSP